MNGKGGFGMSEKLCEVYKLFLCRYCKYRGALGHCRYYTESYTTKEVEIDE